MIPGGRVIWECSVDLSNYLYDYLDSFSNIEDVRVIELGAGHGLLGCTCLHRGCRVVDFSDYNLSVLSSVTWKNIMLNRLENSESRCFAGDWINVSNKFLSE